jgi:hypothetical protein
MPPPEGFGAVKYKRSLPFKGPSGLAIFSGIGLMMGFGWLRLWNVIDERLYVSFVLRPLPDAHLTWVGAQGMEGTIGVARLTFRQRTFRSFPSRLLCPDNDGCP